ncbi:MAG: PKD domain-containing protein [Pseudomonadota bacterium]
MLSVLSSWMESGICTISKSLILKQTIRSLSYTTITFILLSACFVPQICAYANKTMGQPDPTTNRVDGPHGNINYLTLILYQAMLNEKLSKNDVKFDPVFKYQLRDNPMGDSLRTIEGESIYRSGYFYPSDVFKDGAKIGTSYFCLTGNKTLKFPDWLIEAGFTADEPEVWMGLRHFYDPITGKGLTDFSHDWVTQSGNVAVNNVLGRPDMDARTWAMIGPADQEFAANPWSWEKGIESMRNALAQTKSPALRDAQFVIAWRALGETMHLLADMTVPAHVRNDSHPGIYEYAGMAQDMFELFVTEKLIKSVWNKTIGQKKISSAVRDAISWNLLEDMDKIDHAPNLFLCLATYTNRNFFSADTVSGSATYDGQSFEIINANGQNPYPEPKLELLNAKASKDRILWPETIYYRNFPMGSLTQANKIKHLPIVQLSWAASQGLFELAKGPVSYNGFTDSFLVNQAMAEHLLPIAIYANTKLLDWYLPRLEIVLKTLNIDQSTLTGIIKHHPYGVHPKDKPLIINLPEGDQWGRFHELYIDGKKLFFDQYTLKVQQNQIFVDLKKLKEPKLTASSQVSLVLDMGGIRIRSGAIMAAEDRGYYVLTDVKEKDEKYKWEGPGFKSSHEPGKNKIWGAVSINIPKMVSYSVDSELSWETMPKVIPTGGRWEIEYHGKTRSSGETDTDENDVSSYRPSSGVRHGVFHIDYRHDQAVSSNGDCLTGGIISKSGLLSSGQGNIKAGQSGAKKAAIQFYLASTTWRDSMTGGQRRADELFILTGETPAGKLRQEYAYRFVKKLDKDQQQLLEQTLSSQAYKGTAKMPKIDFKSGSTAAAVSDNSANNNSAGDEAQAPKLTALHYVPGTIKKQEPVVFKVDVVNPPESVSYTWWMNDNVSSQDKSPPQPTAWTEKPEVRYTYARAETCYITVWMKNKKTGKFVAKQSWKINIGD